MKIRKTALTLLSSAAVFTAIGANLWGQISPNPPNPIDGADRPSRTRVRKEKLVRSLFVAGELAPVRAVRISVPRFRERGQVPIQAMAPEGSVVKAGDALLQIDNAQLIASLNSEEINLDKDENDLAQKQSELDIQLKDLEMELSTRRLDLEKARLKAEIEKGLISLRDWQDNQFNFERARKEFDKVTQKMAMIRKAAAEELALFRIKRDQSQSRIKAIIKTDRLDKPQYPEIYWPQAQASSASARLLIRTMVDPESLAAAVRDEIGRIDRDLPVLEVSAMDGVIADTLWRPRLAAWLLGLFASLAVSLAVAGLYGVLSYSVSQRTHELGLRMALGAQGRDVLRLVISEGMRLVFIGLAIGLAAAFAFSRFVAGQLYGVKATDPLTFGGVALLLACVALLACWLPARRAAKTDPMISLHHE